MFGFRGMYRGEKIFAVLPRTRALVGANLIEFKLKNPAPRLVARAARDERVRINPEAKQGWCSFELRSGRDLRDCLWWLNLSWRAAQGTSRKP
jgi:hypothetical protein